MYGIDVKVDTPAAHAIKKLFELCLIGSSWKFGKRSQGAVEVPILYRK